MSRTGHFQMSGGNGSRCGFSIDGIAFAALAADTSVWTRHFEHVDALIMQVTSQPRPVGPGSFDTDLGKFPLPAYPRQH